MSYQSPVTQVLNAPRYLSIHQLLDDHAERTPHAPAILAPDRPTLTYARLREHVIDVVQVLNAMGVGRNDRVALILPNGSEMAVAFLAVAACTTCVPLNPASSERELDLYLSGLHAKAVILQSGSDSPARPVARALGIRVIELSPVISAEAGIFTLTGETHAGAELPGFARPKDVALILHTSGTTSRPKLVPHTQTSICIAAHNMSAAVGLVESDRLLNVMPLFHAHGLVTCVFESLMAGSSVVCTPGFRAPDFFAWMAEFKPTWYTAVPTIHQAVLESAPAHSDIIASCPVRFIRSSGAPLPPRVLTELERIFNAPVINRYGLTETCSHVTCDPLPPRRRKRGSVGVAVGSEVAIIDEVGSILPSGVTGEIVVRGASVMQGYDGDSTANRGVFTRGWFRTGDQGYLDTDGYLFVTGRLKEIINRGGEKISPYEVEEVLLQHAAIVEAAVSAMPHAELGEDVCAAVVLRENASITVSEIRQFVGARLADFKVPRQVVFVDEIPKGRTGKVQRIGLAEKLDPVVPGRLETSVKKGFVGPRTSVEVELAAIWARVLGRERVGINEDFFELGGHSLQAVNLFAEIGRVFGKNLPVPILLQAPTLEQLASVLGGQGSSLLSSSLVAIQSKGSRPPFFCVHAEGGHALVFKDLAQRLGPDQPFYAFQARGLDGTQPRHRHVEEMAAHYIQEMRTVQPKGQYFLGGYCFGGTVAFEMAQQLHKQGQRVALLALIDAYGPPYRKFLIWARRAKQRAANHLAYLVRLGPRERLDYVRDKAPILVARIKKACTPDRSPERTVLRALREVQAANARAYSQYVPRLYPGGMTLFRASQQRAERGRDLRMGWSGLASGGLEVHEVPGRHLSIVVEPHVRVLAEQLAACLHEAQSAPVGRPVGGPP